jgi:outer membrane receptor protein involved in Fe transport
MKKALFLFFTICLLSFKTMAQQPGTDIPKGNGKITGQVLDGETNQPVEFANIVLINPSTTKAVDGTICDMEGKFTLAKLAEGTYSMTVTFIGYETKTIENITVDKRGEIALPTIKLSTGAKVLNEVVIEGQRSLIEEKVDRTVYNAEQDATTRGGDATDVLKRVPMLSVDMDGNVSMRGNANILVLINNKPSTITASSVADALKQIPADQIKTVEVITSPSAKYDAEGSAGTINIITKKNTLEGATLNIDSGIGLRGSNLGLNGNYRRGKMGFSLGGYGRASYNVKGSFLSETTTSNNNNTPDDTSDDFPETITQTADTRSNNLFGRYTLGWDYDINKNNYMAASIRYGVRNGTSYQDDVTRVAPIGTQIWDSKSKDNSGTIDVSLDFTHTYEKPQRELSFSAQYSRNNRDNDFYNTYYREPIKVDSLVKNNNKGVNEEITAQVDYQTPIKDNQMLELGAKNITRIVNSGYTYFYALGEGDYVPNTESAQNNNALNYDQNVTAGYISYTLTTKSAFSIKAGTRYEYTAINASYQVKTAELPDPEIPGYGVIVPSVNLSQKLKNGNTVKLAYNRRIQRPSIQYLNPNVNQQNPQNISVGNPDLDPEYTNNYELGYSTFIKGTTLNFSTFVRNTTGSIQSIRDTSGIDGVPKVEGQITTRYDNIGYENAYGLSIFANVNINNKFTLNGGADMYYADLDNQQTGSAAASNSGFVWSGRLFGNYSLPKSWAIQFFGFYRGNRVQLQGSQGGFGTYSLGFRKEFNEKRASLGFAAENFFTKEMKIKSETQTPTIDQKNVNTMRNMSVRLTFSYRIGKMGFDNQPRQRRRKSVNNDDMKDGSGGDGDMGTQNQGGGGGGQRGGSMAAGAVAIPQAKPAQPDSTTMIPDSLSVDASGTWNYTLESPQGATTGSFVLTKENGTYKGTITSARMPQSANLTSTTVNGNELTTNYTMDFNGTTVPITIKGTITENNFEGTLSLGTFRTMPIKATR